MAYPYLINFASSSPDIDLTNSSWIFCGNDVDRLFKETEATEGYKLDIDLSAQSINTPSGKTYQFDIDAFRKHCLLNGLDDIGLTMQHQVAIEAFEVKHKALQPWLFN